MSECFCDTASKKDVLLIWKVDKYVFSIFQTFVIIPINCNTHFAENRLLHLTSQMF